MYININMWFYLYITALIQCMKENYMSSKNWKFRHIQLDRKEKHAVYLTQDEWEYLVKEGEGVASQTVREMINTRKKENSLNQQD